MSQDYNTGDLSKLGLAGQRYSVWVPIPHETLQGFVSSLSRMCAEGGSPPVVFEPHVTVIGGLQHLTLEQILDIAEATAAAVKPFTGKVSDVLIGEAFFQCVFSKVEPESLFAELHSKYRKMAYDDKGFEFIGPNGPNTYVPHISLAYGQPFLSRSAEEQAQIQKLLGTSFQEYFHPYPKSTVAGISFPVNKICVMDTPLQKIEDWKVIKEFPLAGGDTSP